MNWSQRYAKKSSAEMVYKQLAKSYPTSAMSWVKKARWIGPVEVPLNEVDFSAKKTWSAYHETELVKSKIKKIKKGKRKPVVLVDAPKDKKYIIIDGHHRSLAYEKLGEPMVAFIGKVATEKGPWDTFHTKQLPKDPEAKV